MGNIILPKKFNFNNVKGISKNQLEQHYKLYEGYVRKTNEIWKESEELNDFKGSNTTYSKVRSLKLGESYALDGVKLHELYFENMNCKSNIPYGHIMKLIERDFGSYERFVKYFISVGMAMRGWCVLTIEPLDEKLHIIGQDAHDVGSIWMSNPLLVLDVYEHAYMIDFGINRLEYINIFMKNINWKVVNSRLKKYEVRMI
ncbi:superoxide dismutase [Haloimpatiens sp. FM7330]|uniref:superoxide dismutase n=1 Tax=Haloimpatiens sp. FM7330 TaxID=3298610 RepID=UPI00362DF47D